MSIVRLTSEGQLWCGVYLEKPALPRRAVSDLNWDGTETTPFWGERNNPCVSARKYTVYICISLVAHLEANVVLLHV